MSTYVVQPGDTPMIIAHKLSGTPARVGELVRSNAHKPAVRAGNVLTFRDLQVGERLLVPPSWARRVRRAGVAGKSYPQPVPNYAVGPRAGADGGGDDSGHGVEPIRVISGHGGYPGAMPTEGTHAGFGKACCGSCAVGGPCESECTGSSCAVQMPDCSAPQNAPSIPGSTSFPVGFGQTAPTGASTASTIGDALSGWGVPLAVGAISICAGFGLAYVLTNK